MFILPLRMHHSFNATIKPSRGAEKISVIHYTKKVLTCIWAALIYSLSRGK